MKHLITILFLITTLALAVDNRLVTFSVKESLSPSWKAKVDEAVCDIMGETNITKKCYWQVYTNTAGEKWQCATFWRDYQFADIPLTNIEAVLGIKIPKPFRDSITATYGTPTDIGLFATNNPAVTQ